MIKPTMSDWVMSDWASSIILLGMVLILTVGWLLGRYVNPEPQPVACREMARQWHPTKPGVFLVAYECFVQPEGADRIPQRAGGRDE